MKQGTKSLILVNETRERERGEERDLELRAGEEEARQRNLGDLKVETGGRAEEGKL